MSISFSPLEYPSFPSCRMSDNADIIPDNSSHNQMVKYLNNSGNKIEFTNRELERDEIIAKSWSECFYFLPAQFRANICWGWRKYVHRVKAGLTCWGWALLFLVWVSFHVNVNFYFTDLHSVYRVSKKRGNNRRLIIMGSKPYLNSLLFWFSCCPVN